MADLSTYSYKALQQLAKQHGISAKGKATDLLAALTPLVAGDTAKSKAKQQQAEAEEAEQADAASEAPSLANAKSTRGGRGKKDKRAASPPPASESAEPMAVDDEEAAPKKRGRGRPKRAAPATAAAPVQEEDEEMPEEAPEPAPAATNSRKRSVQQAQLLVVEPSNESEAETAAGRKSKKSKASAAAVATDDDGASEAPAAASRVTKRGKRAKRITGGEPEAAQQPPASRRPSDALAVPSNAGSRRPSKTIVTAHPPGSPSTPLSPPVVSPQRARPSLAASNRKRWSRLPVELFGSVVAPPVVGRGSGGNHSTGLAPEALRKDFAARHSGARVSSASPSKRSGSALLAAARRVQKASSPAPPTPRQVAAYTPQAYTSTSAHLQPPAAAAASPSMSSSLASLASPRLNLPLSTSSSASQLPNARSKPSTSSRLSFTRFPATTEGAVGQPTPVKTIPPILFESGAYATGEGGLGGFSTGVTTAAGGPKRPPAGVGASKSSVSARANRLATSAAAASVAQAAARAVQPTTAAPAATGKTLFSSKARLGRTTPAAAAAAASSSSQHPAAAAAASSSSRVPLSSPPRASLAATLPSSSLSALGLSSAASARASAAAGPAAKFDLAASLKKPIGWEMKRGAIKPTTVPSTAGAGGLVTNLNRTQQLKQKDFGNTKAVRQQAAASRTVDARQNKLQQARGRTANL